MHDASGVAFHPNDLYPVVQALLHDTLFLDFDSEHPTPLNEHIRTSIRGVFRSGKEPNFARGRDRDALLLAIEKDRADIVAILLDGRRLDLSHLFTYAGMNQYDANPNSIKPEIIRYLIRTPEFESFIPTPGFAGILAATAKCPLDKSSLLAEVIHSALALSEKSAGRHAAVQKTIVQAMEYPLLHGHINNIRTLMEHSLPQDLALYVIALAGANPKDNKLVAAIPEKIHMLLTRHTPSQGVLVAACRAAAASGNAPALSELIRHGHALDDRFIDNNIRPLLSELPYENRAVMRILLSSKPLVSHSC